MFDRNLIKENIAKNIVKYRTSANLSQKEFAKKLGVDIKNCIVIEDSEYGIAAGKRAGAYVIARREERFACCQERADKIVNDIAELYSFLVRMLS